MNEELLRKYENCRICPRECGVNRLAGERGVCGCDSKIYAARAALHMWEEPCVSGENGSGAIFFSGCNLRCVFCQNHNISTMNVAREVSVDRLCEIFFELREKGAENINLVTPSHCIPYITTVVERCKKQGFDIPVVYNSGGYESVESLKLLDGLIDVYLPDFKYMDNKTASEYSKAPDYPEKAKSALTEMYRQTGKPEFNQRGIMTKGVIVRHLVLPGCEKDSEKVIRYLYETYGNNIYMSIMSQYTPLVEFVEKKCYPELCRKVDRVVYDRLIDYAIDIGVENAFIQEEDVADESFIPLFDFEGI